MLESLSWFKVSGQLLSPTGWYGYEDFIGDKTKRFTLFRILPKTDGSVKLVLTVQLFAALALMLGVIPQLMAFICFVTLISVHNRTPYVLNACDTIRRFLCFFLIFAASGQQ